MSDIRQRRRILAQFLAPGVLDQRGAWNRELKFFNQLLKQYPDLEFWKRIKPFIPLDTLLYFKSVSGETFLKLEWGYYMLVKVKKQKKAEEDLDRDVDKLETSLNPPISVDRNNKTDSINKKSKSRSAIDWADSM